MKDFSLFNVHVFTRFFPFLQHSFGVFLAEWQYWKGNPSVAGSSGKCGKTVMTIIVVLDFCLEKLIFSLNWQLNMEKRP